MRILHTSDWHIGRTFHNESTTENLQIVLTAIVSAVTEHRIDVILIAGDVFDTSTPSADYVQVLDDTLADIREAGAQIVMTSGNHDSARRLGYQSRAAAFGGIHVFTRPEQAWTPAIIDVDGESVAFYGIPYLEPRLFAPADIEAGTTVSTSTGTSTSTSTTKFRTHEQVLRFVMDKINEDRTQRGGPSIVLAHCFAANISGELPTPDSDGETVDQGDVEIDITAGGLGIVPLSAFDGPDYVALGHLHGRHHLTDRIRYSGAPLHYSFGERAKPRGGWIVDLGVDKNGTDEVGADALSEVRWLDFPIPRRLTQLTGTLDDLLTNTDYAKFEGDWVKAMITDQARPLDAMRQLQARFPHCATMHHVPEVVIEAVGDSYAARVNGKTDRELVTGFVEHVRNGVGPSPEEQQEIDDVLASILNKAASK